MGSGSLAKYVQFGFMYMYASYFVFCMQRRVILYQPALWKGRQSLWDCDSSLSETGCCTWSAPVLWTVIISGRNFELWYLQQEVFGEEKALHQTSEPFIYPRKHLDRLHSG